MIYGYALAILILLSEKFKWQETAFAGRAGSWLPSFLSWLTFWEISTPPLSSTSSFETIPSFDCLVDGFGCVFDREVTGCDRLDSSLLVRSLPAGRSVSLQLSSHTKTPPCILLPFLWWKEKVKLSLFVIGDSFAGPVEKGHFPSAANYSFANWNSLNQSDILLHVDSNQYNVLVLQCSEKHILIRWEKNSYKPYLFPFHHERNDTSGVGFEYRKKPETFLREPKDSLENKVIAEQNIGILLFSNPFVLAIKESKAQLNRFLLDELPMKSENILKRKF